MTGTNGADSDDLPQAVIEHALDAARAVGCTMFLLSTAGEYTLRRAQTFVPVDREQRRRQRGPYIEYVARPPGWHYRPRRRARR